MLTGEQIELERERMEMKRMLAAERVEHWITHAHNSSYAAICGAEVWSKRMWRLYQKIWAVI